MLKRELGHVADSEYCRTNCLKENKDMCVTKIQHIHPVHSIKKSRRSWNTLFTYIHVVVNTTASFNPMLTLNHHYPPFAIVHPPSIDLGEMGLNQYIVAKPHEKRAFWGAMISPPRLVKFHLVQRRGKTMEKAYDHHPMKSGCSISSCVSLLVSPSTKP